MGLWKEMNDFSMYDKVLPCVLCKGNSSPTLIGGHFKCLTCDHLFNEDGSVLQVECHCKGCNPEKEKEVEKEPKSLLQKVVKKLKTGVKKKKKK